MTINKATLQVLIFREGPLMVARCLEHDIAAEGENIGEAWEVWKIVFKAQILVDIRAGKEPLADIGPAPDLYFDMFRHAMLLESTPIRLPDTVPMGLMKAAMHPELRAY